MDDRQTKTSRYQIAITDYLPEFGRALLIGAVEFSHSGVWIAEHYVIPPEDAPIKGCCIRTYFNARSIPTEILPTPADELNQAISLAEAALGQLLFEKDRELMRVLRPISNHVRAEVTPKSLAIIYLQGEFTKGLQAIHSATECEALAKFLADLLQLPRFSVEKKPSKSDGL